MTVVDLRTKKCDCGWVGLLKALRWSLRYAWSETNPVTFWRRFSGRMLGYAREEQCPFCIRLWKILHF